MSDEAKLARRHAVLFDQKLFACTTMIASAGSCGSIVRSSSRCTGSISRLGSSHRARTQQHSAESTLRLHRSKCDIKISTLKKG
eukprot:2055147-Pleurochrysis_carterae.AAC.1